ncbi:hypothetical protein KO500_16670 [Cellulophaga baltica]|uniref:hypothetical protein n=1 Tax=Cellulophaga TaxID=104264 RepID=UPI001C072DC5|nr:MULTISPECIES: hypothetical protein [Cellulophaga]MBU2998077.1 hypothetical protein [Cellulophaga baltica]MDO6769479.1 hypothetical protein [Cellulophaga sp. 1_MG-2023]
MIKKIIVTSVIIISLSACNFLSSNSRKKAASTDDSKQLNSEEKNIVNNSDDLTITPKYDEPRYKELMTQFEKQEHRFEIDACEFKYNGKSFFIGDSYEKILSIFGGHEDELFLSKKHSKSSFNYDDIKLRFRQSEPEKKLIVLDLALDRRFTGDVAPPFEIILLRKIPYKLGNSLNEFMDLSDLNHDKLKHTHHSFYFEQEKCTPNKNGRISTTVHSNPIYKNIGGGHMTIRGAFDPESTGPIRNLTVRLSTQ